MRGFRGRGGAPSRGRGNSTQFNGNGHDSGTGFRGRGLPRARSQARGMSRGGPRGRGLGGQNDHNRITRPLGMEKLQKLYDEHEELTSIDLMKRLTGDGSFMARVAATSEDSNLKALEMIMAITATATRINYNDIREMVFNFRESIADSELLKAGSRHVQMLVAGIHDPTEIKTKLRISILKNMIVILVEIISNMPSKVDAIQDQMSIINLVMSTEGVQKVLTNSPTDTYSIELYAQRLADLWKQSIQKQDTKATLKPKTRADMCEEMAPPQNFRDIPIFPTKDEILGNALPYLRRNLIDRAYEDVEHYLDVQFRLLREDYLHDLRVGIQGEPQGKGKVQELLHYRNVEIASSQVDRKSGKILNQVYFPPIRRIKWEYSKRLNFGSLVCFTSDNFVDDLIFGVVFERDPKLLQAGTFFVTMEKPNSVKINRKYMMVESTAYFEAYRPVLEGLKGIDPLRMPFIDYLIKCRTDVSPPQYLIQADGEINFRPLMAPAEKPSQIHPKQYLITGSTSDSEDEEMFADPMLRSVFDDTEWPSAADLRLDQSQWEALRGCLTREVAIVQGPPGTGKTYIGWQIAKLLLHPTNRKLWNPDQRSPMLVVCYTNHALDQFLEGILPFIKQPGELVRVGGRSKNPAMERHLIHKLRQTVPRSSNRNDAFAFREACHWQNELESQLNILSIKLQLSRREMANSLCLNAIIPEEVAKQLKLGNKSDESDKNMWSWLMFEIPVWDQSFQQNKMNLNAVLYLMEQHYDEMLAKKALLLTGNCNLQAAVNWLLQNSQTPNFFIIPNKVYRWPMVDDIYNLAAELEITEELSKYALEINGCSYRNAKDWVKKEFASPVGVENEVETGEIQGTLQDQLEIHGERNAMLDFEMMDRWAKDKASQKEREEKDRETMKSMRREQFLNIILVENMIQGQVFVDKAPTKEAISTWEELKRLIKKTEPMNAAMAAGVQDVWKLHLADRWKLYRYWESQHLIVLRQQIEAVEKQYAGASRNLSEQRNLADIEIMKKSNVIGMTTSCAARYQGALQVIGPKIVIMEEAAEVLESHLVTSLSPSCQHAILIGDHQQLRPNPSVYKLAKNYNLEISLFERLINNGFEYTQLKLQHRMRPEISDSLMPMFYTGLLNDASVYRYGSVPGMRNNLFFIDHEHLEEGDGDSKSHKNVFEAEFAVYLAKYLIQQDIAPENITILSCYKAQFFHIRGLVDKLVSMKGIRLAILDNYQGEENQIIILSLVRSNKEKRIGFLKNDNRVCVALSRAREGLYCLGNFDHFTNESETWMKIGDALKSTESIGKSLSIECSMHGTVTEITAPKEFQQLAPEGGCLEFCNYRMDCGHSCEMRCHAYDIEHKITKCNKPCPKFCRTGLHPCQKLCNQDCGECSQKVVKLLPCNHRIEAKCYKDPFQIQCSKPCEKLLGCGHRCSQRCQESHNTYCKVIVEKRLPCGHSVNAECSSSAADIDCEILVDKNLPCGHKIKAPCSVPEGDIKCNSPCNKQLPDCEHICTGTCSSCRKGRLHVQCNQPCTQILVCGHACEGKCCRTCPPCPKPCQTQCPHSVCSQKTIKLPKKKGRKNTTRGRTCGEICPPCAEECNWSCKHHKCKDKCNVPCKRKRCIDSCDKMIDCIKGDHQRPCIGVCGEACPDICKECEPERWKNDVVDSGLFGTEDEVGTRFIQLPDCPVKCILPVEGVDTWVDVKSEESAITPISCPKCSTTIKTCLRYGPELKRRVGDIQMAKNQISGNPEELAIKRDGILSEIDTIQAETLSSIRRNEGNPYLSKALLPVLKDDVSKPAKNHLSRELLLTWSSMLSFTKNLMKTEQECLKFLLKRGSSELERGKWKLPGSLEYISKYFGKQTGKRGINDVLASSIHEEILCLKEWIQKNVRSATSLMLEQFASELQRLALLSQIICFISWILTSPRNIPQQELDQIDSYCVLMLKKLNSSCEIKGKLETAMNDMISKLNNDYKSELNISESERIAIVKAVGLTKGKWFKCPKGHIYCIGECGGATEKQKCPECKETIGGLNHRLAEGNQLAPEMDGAEAPAWPSALDR